MWGEVGDDEDNYANIRKGEVAAGAGGEGEGEVDEVR